MNAEAMHNFSLHTLATKAPVKETGASKLLFWRLIGLVSIGRCKPDIIKAGRKGQQLNKNGCECK